MVSQIEDWKLQKACWDKGIFVYPKCTVRGYTKKPAPIKLVVEVRGKKKYGKLEYEQNSKEHLQKVRELYEHYYLHD